MPWPSCVCVWQGEEGPPSLEYIKAKDLFPQKELVKEDESLQVSKTVFINPWEPLLQSSTPSALTPTYMPGKKTQCGTSRIWRHLLSWLLVWHQRAPLKHPHETCAVTRKSVTAKISLQESPLSRIDARHRGRDDDTGLGEAFECSSLYS